MTSIYKEEIEANGFWYQAGDLWLAAKQYFQSVYLKLLAEKSVLENTWELT